MSDQSEQPWSGAPNAPDIPGWLYLDEKASFAEVIIFGISYGIIIILYFQCMSALLNPVGGLKRGIRWGLVAQSTALFLFISLPTSIILAMQSVSYIDNRAFPGDSSYPPGPLGWPGPAVFTILYSIGFPLNQWIADGILLYRCWIIYSMNYWAIAFPFLLYIVTIATGILQTYEEELTGNFQQGFAVRIYTAYASIALALNVILMMMIIIRLVLHNRAMRKAVGHTEATGGLYQTITTMLIESFSLYSVSFFVYIVLRSYSNYLLFPFGAIYAAAQVISPLLIIKRVATRRAMTSEIISGHVGTMQFKSDGEGSSGWEGTIPDEIPLHTVDTHGENPAEKVDGTENRNIEEVPL